MEGSGTIFATFILKRRRRLTSLRFDTKRAIMEVFSTSNEKLYARSKNMFCFSDIDAAAGAAGANAAAGG